MNQPASSYHLDQDEKIIQVMAYTATSLFWGDLRVKNLIRVSTWLRTNMAPTYISLLNAKALVTTSSSPARPGIFPELHIPVPQILAFHMIPPARDPLDFDPTEPNRKMEPVNVFIGTFLIKASIRIAENGSLKRFLDVNRETYTSLYETEISNQIIPGLKPISVPFILVRQESAVFTNR